MVAPVVILAYSDHPEVILSVNTEKTILFCSVLFCFVSILFYSILFYSILFYSILFRSVLFYVGAVFI